MKFTPTQLALIGGGVLIVVLIVLLFAGVIPGLRVDNSAKTGGSITVWGVFDNEKAFTSSLIADFQKTSPNVKITYRQMDESTYEQDLINALASGTGPDVFYIKNDWLIKQADKLSPLDPAVFPPSKLAQLFPDVVSKDFVGNGKVYALPLYLDTMALFYNKTIFDQAGIAQPPATWQEFEADVAKLTTFDQTGVITRAGAAIGTSARNINEATDLLSLIMIQDGVQMVSNNLQQATFSVTGKPALAYYTSFVNPQSPHYTWDPLFHYSIDAFAEESTAMIFNYNYQIPQIKAKNPFLNFAIAPMLQTDPNTSINYANYWGMGVSTQSKRPDLAWAFIQAATTDPNINLDYLNAALRPPALRSLIASTVDDPSVGVFSRQALTATDWPQVDATAVDAAFTKMIDSVDSGQLDSSLALKQAEDQVTQLLQARFGSN